MVYKESYLQRDVQVSSPSFLPGTWFADIFPRCAKSIGWHCSSFCCCANGHNTAKCTGELIGHNVSLSVIRLPHVFVVSKTYKKPLKRDRRTGGPRLDINLEDEILEISRSFHVLVHTARGGIVDFHVLVLKAHWLSEGFWILWPLSFNVNRIIIQCWKKKN
jgi:hypothetical protein